MRGTGIALLCCATLCGCAGRNESRAAADADPREAAPPPGAATAAVDAATVAMDAATPGPDATAPHVAGPPPTDLPPGYVLQIDEPFSSPASFDGLVFADPGDWRFQPAMGGALESFAATYAPPYRSPDNVAVVAARRFGSFVLEVEIMETSPRLDDPHRDYCILWDVESPTRFYYAHIAAKHDPAIAHNIHIVDDAARRPITRTASAGYDWGVGVWRKLRVVRDTTSGLMEVRDAATGALLLSASDRTFQGGFIGFGSIGDPGRVRNLRVWAPAATPGPPPFFQPRR